jgi:hypothetical protein
VKAISTRLERASRIVSVVLLAACLPLLAADHGPHGLGRAQSDPSDAKKVPIYIKDFELVAVPTKRVPAPPRNAPNGNSADTDPPAVQARRIIDGFGTTLTQTFQKNGYTAARENGSLPTEGLLLRGVFAEPDDQNRIRRAILGAGAPGPNLLLYVGAFNLTRPDQPLYLRAPVHSDDPHYGPIISLNSYVPMVKFDVPKDPAASDVEKICSQIVSQITALLVANPNAMSQ